MNKLICVAWLLMVGGCAIPPNAPDRVSAGLETRTGHTVTNTTPGESLLPPGVSVEDGLSQEEAIAIALWNNAAFLETLADLGLARADLIQAGLLANPTLTMLFPAGPKQFEFTAKFPLEALWLRPRRVAAAKVDYERTAERLIQTGLDLVRDVKLAYIDLALARQRVELAEQTGKLAEQIGQLAAARLAAGDVSELEVSNARVDALQTTEAVARSRQDVLLAKQRLQYLLGLGLDTKYAEVKTQQPPALASAPDDVSLLITNALAARPDLRAAELGLEAAGQRAGIARTEIYTFTGLLDANGWGNTFEIGPGMDVPLPVLHQNQGQRALAKARVEKAARQYTTVRDRIVLEVRDAHTRLRQAQESFNLWREQILPPLREAVGQAEKAYETGDVSFLLVLETTRKLEDARTKEATAAADVHRATAELERSIGGRLNDHNDHAKKHDKQ